jgi:hypothetical protein
VLRASTARAAASPREVLDRIARGDIFFYELVVPEGKNMFDIAAAVEHLGLFQAARFMAAARNPAMIRDLDPRAPTLEGYLFPDTYKLSRHTTPERLCRTMTGKFRDAWRSLQANAGVHETVTLASLVEKEANSPPSASHIAAVFENRLRIGMKLDCDPTTVYAACWATGIAAIHRSDLTAPTPTTRTATPACRPDPSPTPASRASAPRSRRPNPTRSISSRCPMVRAPTSFPTTSPRTKAPPPGIIVASTSKSVKQQLRDYLAAERPAAITEAVWTSLMERLAPVSESYLRDLLRNTGLPFAQPYAGIRQHTFEEFERSLRDMLRVYTEAMAAGNRDLASYCRRQVIGAKDRAKFVAGNARTPPERKAQQEEMVQWMLVWLENPEVFPAWADARMTVSHAWYYRS